jgi:hypothetical protein
MRVRMRRDAVVDKENIDGKHGSLLYEERVLT